MNPLYCHCCTVFIRNTRAHPRLTNQPSVHVRIPIALSPGSSEAEHMSSQVPQAGGQALEEGSTGAATSTHNNSHVLVWYDNGNRGLNNLTVRGRRGQRSRRGGPGHHNADFLVFSLAFAVVVSFGVGGPSSTRMLVVSLSSRNMKYNI